MAEQARKRRQSFGEKAVDTARSFEKRVEHALTCMWDDLAHWQKDNHFIILGYRPASGSFRRSFGSLFYFHNESVNVYTHLVGALISVYLAIYLHLTIPPRYPSSTPSDILALGTFFFSCFLCLSFSATFHLISNHSHSVAKFGNQLDYLGIVVLIVGSFVPTIYYGFFCHPDLQKLYWGMIFSLGVLCGVTTLKSAFRTPKWRPLRAGMFVAMGLSGIVPVVHGLRMYGYKRLEERMALDWMLAQGGLYVIGAGIYAARIPERWAPGRFDLVGASHQLFHAFVLMAAAAHLRGLVRAYDFLHERGAEVC